MCTAITYHTKNFYFGRTLDYDCSYSESVVISPRNYSFGFSDKNKSHYALIGMAHVADGYPLYYDGGNERGLAIAGLNFVGNTFYGEEKRVETNIAQYELLPYLLSQCASVKEAVMRLKSINVVSRAFSKRFPAAQLHYLIADRNEAVTVEFTKEGMKIYDNPIGVLTNNPPFPEQMSALNDYINVSPKPPRNGFSDRLKLDETSRGMGALGLPGDWSSKSRFARAAFVKLNSAPKGSSEEESVSEFFHILASVAQPRGTGVFEEKYEVTIYSSCFSAAEMTYYYTTYGNRRIHGLRLKDRLDGRSPIVFPLALKEEIVYE